MKRIILTIAGFALTSCFMSEKGITLPGKIVVRTSKHVCSIYDNSYISEDSFKLRDDQHISYSGLQWLHSDDSFIGGEYLKTTGRGITQGNIVRFDLTGAITERIYESQTGEIAWPEYPSRDDKWLLFTTHQNADPEVYPFEGITPMLSLSIMDLKQKKIIKKIDSIGRSPNFELHETPWLYDENRFVYSILGETQIANEELAIIPLDKGLAGIYIYDFVRDKNELLVPNGRFAIASPVATQIAYIKDRSVWIMDLKNSSTRMLYEGGSKEKVNDIHWTPDGKYVYLVYFDYYLTDDLFITGEKLIEVSSGKDTPFKKIRHGFETYTWK